MYLLTTFSFLQRKNEAVAERNLKKFEHAGNAAKFRWVHTFPLLKSGQQLVTHVANNKVIMN